MQADFSEIYKEYSKRLYLFIYGKCRNRDTAEDVLQTTFLKAIENIDRFRGDCSIYTWLCRIAMNTLYSEGKRFEQKNSSLDTLFQTNPELFTSEDADPLTNLIEQENYDELRCRISKLKPDHQKIINLRLNNIPFRIIGEYFGKSESWAKVNYHRAVKKLKNERLGE